MTGRRIRRRVGGTPSCPLRWIAALASVLVLWAAAPSARAQAPEDESNPLDFQEEESDTAAAPGEEGESPQGPGRRAGSDSTRADRVLTTLHPSYTTAYDVARQTTNWNQEFKFGTRIGFFNFDNVTRFNIRTDSGRNETRRDGSNLTNLRLLKIPLNATIDLRRSSVQRPGNDRQPGEERQNDDVGLDLSTRDLRKKLLAINHRVSFGGGLSYRSDQTQLSGSRSQSFDSGLRAEASWKGTWDPWKVLSMDGDAKWARIQKESRLEKETVSVSQPTANLNRSFGLRARIDPGPWISSHVSLSGALTDDESYNTVAATPGQTAGQQLEHRFTNQRAISAGFDLLKNIKGMNLNFEVSKSTQELDYRIRRDFAYTGDTFSWRGNLKADWLGTDVDITLSSNQDALNRATSAGTDTRNNIFEGKLSRKIAKKLQARFNWLARANQVFFDDLSLDRDELRTKLQPSVSYSPNQKWRVNAAFIRSTSRRSEINPRQALQSRQEENFNVDVQISYKLSEVTDISQVYSISALYTTFDYNPSRDRLVSTQRIATSLSTQVGPSCDFTFEHRFVLADSGPFRIDESGTRIFERDLRKYTQELNSTVKYRLTSWFSARLSSQFLRTDDVNEFAGRRNTTRNLNLQTGLDIQKTLQGSVVVRASGQYVQSNVQDPFWSITSGLTKDF